MGTTLTGRIGGASAIADPLTDLEAVEALSATGIAVRTAANTWALRSLSAPAAGISVSFGDGVSGNPWLALANDLAQLEALSGTGIAVRTASDSWAQRTLAVSGTGLSVSNADGVGGNPTVTINPSQVVSAGGAPSLAAQSDQETATSTTTYVAPARQQFHPSAAKCWAYVTVSAGTPTLQASYNITSITDTATGELTITIATDFSSANWAAVMSSETTTTNNANLGKINSKTVGSIQLDNLVPSWGPSDPTAWNFVGYGDQ